MTRAEAMGEVVEEAEERSAVAVVDAESDADEEAGDIPLAMLVGQAALVEQATRSAEEMAAAARAEHAAAAAAVLAGHGGDSDSDGEGGNGAQERCMIWGAKGSCCAALA